LSNQNVILRAERIQKSFPIGKKGMLEVLKGIDLEIRKGEIIAIVGASGAGKSTLLHIIGGLDRPTQGSVQVDGIDIAKLSDEALAKFRNKEIGFVFQFHHLLPEFTALENVVMPALILGEKFAKARERAEQLLHEVGLAERMEHKPMELSGGEQQRVAVARALMNQPKIILADEPSGNLDRANSEILHTLIVDLNRAYMQTFIIVTHNPDLSTLAGRILKIVDGKVERTK
jgi:lipoprotein-releasing system ATP-binding protein